MTLLSRWNPIIAMHSAYYMLIVSTRATKYVLCAVYATTADSMWPLGPVTITLPDDVLLFIFHFDRE